MTNSVIKYSLFAVILIFLQVVLFNNIQFSGYVNPYVYVMILLLLPAVIPSWILLIISFCIGFIIDLFAGSPGMHASATVMAGFTRPYVLRIISPRDGYESGTELSMASYGFRWFLLYTTIIVLIHHLTLFYVEVFRLAEFFSTFLRVLLSSVFTIGFILLLESYRKRR